MLTRPLELYKCPVCDTVVEIVDELSLELVCCGPPMVRLEAQSASVGSEPHVPIVIRDGNRLRVRVGARGHPMAVDHRICWIELVTDSAIHRQILTSGQAPHADFVACEEVVTVRAYCNRHGLWESSGEALTPDQAASSGVYVSEAQSAATG